MEQEVNHEIEGGVKNEMEGSEERSWRKIHHEVEAEVYHEVEGKYVIKWKRKW